MRENYNISGKSKTLKLYADIDDTIDAIQRIVRENHSAVMALSKEMEGDTEEETFHNIWYFVRNHIRYQNDKIGTEQLRTPQRTLHDRIGDCDDFSILISSILTNLEYNHQLVIAAYKQKDQWQHIYPAVYDENGIRYVIDCVPEIPYFNYEAKPIKNRMLIKMNKASLLHSANPLKNTNMRLEELGQGIESEMIQELITPFDVNSLQGFDNELDELETLQGLLGNIALVDEDDEYDSVLSGSELQENILLKQLLDAKTALQQEISNPTELSQLNDNRTELQLVSNIIDNFQDEEAREEAIAQAISKGTLYSNFYKTIKYGLDDAVNGLHGDDEDLYYLKIMDEQGMFDNLDDLEGLGLFKNLKTKIKAGVQKFKEKHPKLAKIAHAVKKFSPATFALRKSMDLFLRANVFHMAEKLSIGYATEAQAKQIGYTSAEWKEFVKAKNKAEDKWYAIGGKKEYFRNMIKNSGGAKKAGLRGELGIAPAVIAAVTKVFGTIINVFKKLKLKKKDGSIKEETSTPSNPVPVTNPINLNLNTGKSANTNKNASPTNNYPSKQSSSIIDESLETEDTTEMAENTEVHEKSGVVTETITDENGKEKKIYKDKDGNEINRFKAFYLKNKIAIIVISIILVVGIIALIIWKARQKSLDGLGSTGLTKRQENFIKRQGLNNRAYASLVREEIKKDKKPYNSNNRKSYYKKVFQDAFSRPLSQKQTNAAIAYNGMYREVRELAKAKGGGSQAWTEAWSEVKKKSHN